MPKKSWLGKVREELRIEHGGCGKLDPCVILLYSAHLVIVCTGFSLVSSLLMGLIFDLETDVLGLERLLRKTPGA